MNDLLMGHGGLERRDEPRGAVSGADATARAKTQEDVERAAEKLHTVRVKNKERFDGTH